jgi:hypothetical protein
VFVYDRPAAGWSSESQAAELIASDGGRGDNLGGSVAVSGSTVVAGGSNPAAALYVFSEPSGGWAGVVHESATLSPSPRSGCGALFRAVISGATIVAGCRTAGELLVFTEPAGGWSGQVHESAVLRPASGRGRLFPNAAVGISGDTIVANGYVPGGGEVLVFQRPRAGWHGVVHQAAVLSAGNHAYFNPIAIWGATVFAAPNAAAGRNYVYVFRRPRHGWAGHVAEAARIVYRSMLTPDGSMAIAASDRDVAVSFDALGDNHNCPCPGGLAVFTEPRRGWSGTIPSAATHQLDSENGGSPIAIQGQIVFASGGVSVQLLRFHAPRLSR